MKNKKKNIATDYSGKILTRHQLIKLPTGYKKFLEELKSRIRFAQVKATFSANYELTKLYWDLGCKIVERQQKDGWGTSVIEYLAKDIQNTFPGMNGFSTRNIWRMRAFYLAYTKEVKKLPQPVAEIDGINLPRTVASIKDKI